MKAEYFYNRMMEYTEESHRTGKYYYGYDCGCVTIHRKGDDCTIYTIYSDKDVVVRTKDVIRLRYLSKLSELTGDDFELFSEVQIFKSGYFKLNTKSEEEVELIMSKICDSLEDSKEEAYSLYECKRGKSGELSSFRYVSKNNIDVYVKTVNMLRKDNVERKYYDLQSIPYIRDIKDSEAIHVDLVHFTNEKYTDEQYKHTIDKLRDRISSVAECEWVECEIKEPCYY